MADKDDVDAPASADTGKVTGEENVEDVATPDPVPDVPQDVSTEEPAAASDETDAHDEPDLEPDVAAHLVDDGADEPDEASVDAADVADDPAEDATETKGAADDTVDDGPAWYVGEPEPLPGLGHLPEPVSAPEPVVDVSRAEAVDVPDGATPVVLPDDPADDIPDDVPASPYDEPAALHLGPLEPETTALTLRPPAELFREHRRRERRRTLTFLGIFLGVLGMGLASFTFFQGRWSWPFGTQTVAAPICPTPTATGLAPADVSVKVYNAGTRKGLAKTVATTMRKRGFTIGEVGNDPQEAKVKGAAIVRHGPDGLDAARTVAAQVDGAVAYVDDGRVSQSVDLVLGTKWTKFRTVAAANKVLTPVVASPSGCVPASTDEETGTGTGTTSPTPSAT